MFSLISDKRGTMYTKKILMIITIILFGVSNVYAKDLSGIYEGNVNWTQNNELVDVNVKTTFILEQNNKLTAKYVYKDPGSGIQKGDFEIESPNENQLRLKTFYGDDEDEYFTVVINNQDNWNSFNGNWGTMEASEFGGDWNGKFTNGKNVIKMYIENKKDIKF